MTKSAAEPSAPGAADLDRTRTVAIAVAPNGGRKSRDDHPAIPIHPDAIARTAAICLEEGACMIHAHARDAQGRHSLNPDINRSLIEAVRAAVGDKLLVQMTTEAVSIYSPAEQMASVKAVRPEACSLALRELAPTAAEEPALADFLLWLHGEDIATQFIVYTPEDVARLAELRRRGLVPGSGLSALYVLGRYTAGQRSHPADALPMLAVDVPDLADWMLCGFGADEAACAAAAFALGGGARVGFENNILLVDGSVAADNGALVRQAAAMAGMIGRTAMTADAYRQRLSQLR